MSKKIKSDSEVNLIHRLCIGSAEELKNDINTKGMFYFLNEDNKIVYWDIKGKTRTEKIFDTMEDFCRFVDAL